MAFHLEKVIFINRAPFDNLEIDFKDKGINVLAAVNGKGKTTILSYIVDAFYELAKLHFSNEFEGKENKYYRVSSGLDSLNADHSSYVYLRFRKDENIIDYIDIRKKCTKEEYENAINITNKIPYQKISDEFGKQNNIKYWQIDSDKREFCLSMFGNNILTYFPSYRYETPAFLNDSYQFKIDYKKEGSFSGYLTNPIEVITGIRQIANWIMDVVLDWEVNKQTQQVQDSNGNTFSIDKTPEFSIWRNLNEILRKALSSKQYESRIRMGIGKRIDSGTRLAIVTDIDDKPLTVIPNLFRLSSGELAVLCCFWEILRQADELRPNISLDEIQGIVLIDEVDKHLHIKLQKEILPKLFNLFPNVQFIVSSHSPFLNMGLADDASERTCIFDLDNNGIACEPTNNKLYQEVYEMMINENQRFADKYRKLEKEIGETNKPIIITEGKTDIKHIQKAKEKLEISDIDFETIEVEEQPDGDKSLIKLLEQLGKVARNNKVIGIFDRDRDDTIKSIENGSQKYKDYGHGVYGFCIPVPESRKLQGQEKISIEYLYSDEEIKRPLENGCRLFFGSEFNKRTGVHLTDSSLILGNQDGRGVDKILENNGGQGVYDHAEKNYLAKKDEFAEAIKNDKIKISEQSWNNFSPIFEMIREILEK